MCSQRCRPARWCSAMSGGPTDAPAAGSVHPTAHTQPHDCSPSACSRQRVACGVLTMLSRTLDTAESDRHTDGLRDESQTGGSPTCQGLHRRDASQYRYSQPRMVHSRGVVCAHTGHLKMAQCGTSYLAHILTARAPIAFPFGRCTCATLVRQHAALCQAFSRHGDAR